jgi:GNAT superfamily N-acetyltransferase
MHVRRAHRDDFHRIMVLYRQLHPEDPVLTDGTERALFNAIVSRQDLTIFALEDEGLIQATCYLNVIPNLTRGARPYAVLENVVTDEPSRGRGWGKAVIRHALGAAWESNCYKVMLQTGSKRESTLAFYRACGFSGTDKHGFVSWRPVP